MARALLLLTGLLAACCPRVYAEHQLPPAPEYQGRAWSMEKPFLLELVRYERLKMERPLRPADADAVTPEYSAHDEALLNEDEHDAQADDEGFYRTVHVRSGGLATQVDIAGYLIRAIDKKQRGSPTRTLVQIQGPVRTCADCKQTHKKSIRRRAREAIASVRPQLRGCYARALARDPRIIVKQPAGLVMEQALRFEHPPWRIDVDLAIGNGGAVLVAVNARSGDFFAEDLACVHTALQSLPAIVRDDNTPIAQLNLFMWVERGGAYETSPARALALGAAVFGWIELDRDAGEALAMFKDAQWLYRIPEFQALIAEAQARLHRPKYAVSAYRRYLEGRPNAPDKPEIDRRIAALENKTRH